MPVLAIRCFVNTMEAKMEMACSVNEDWSEVWGAKLKIGLWQLTRKIVLLLLTLAAMSISVRANVDDYFCQGRRHQLATT